MKKLVLAVLGAGFVSMIALAAVSEDDPVILNYVPADEAQKAIQKELGDRAGSAVLRVNQNENWLALDPKHPDRDRVRAFLKKFDEPQEQVHIAAVITRRIAATAQAPAREEVLARPVVVAGAGKSIKLKIPEGKGATEVELTITPIPKK